MIIWGSSGGGTVDASARATAAINKAALDTIATPAGQTVPAGDLTWQDGKLWENTSGGAATVPTPATEANMAADSNFDPFQGSTQIDEVVLSTAALSGAAPAGAKSGFNTTTGDEYYNNGGNWAPVPTDPSPTHYRPPPRGTATRGSAPTAGETAATLVNGSTADIWLSDGTKEEWGYPTGAWVLRQTVEPPSQSIATIPVRDAGTGNLTGTTAELRITRDADGNLETQLTESVPGASST